MAPKKRALPEQPNEENMLITCYIRKPPEELLVLEFVQESTAILLTYTSSNVNITTVRDKLEDVS